MVKTICFSDDSDAESHQECATQVHGSDGESDSSLATLRDVKRAKFSKSVHTETKKRFIFHDSESDSDSDSDGYHRVLGARPKVQTRAPDVALISPNPPLSPVDLVSDEDSDSESDACSVVDAAVARGDVVPAGPRVKSRGWCFTINNYTEADVHRIRDWFDEPNNARYCLLGYEVAPETGTKHIQGYVYVDNPRFGNVLRHAFGGKGHWEVAKGTPKQNHTYCTKGGDFLEMGTLPSQGKRSDLESLARRVCSDNVSLKGLAAAGEFSDVATWMRYSRSFETLKNVVAPKRDPSHAPTVVWLHGPTGCGKSRLAYEKYPDAYRWPGAGYWFDGYDGHDTIVFDDFRHDAGITFSNLLRIIDRFPMSLPVKGGFVELAATTFVFTTPMEPANVYPTNERVNQLMRRITEVKEMGVADAPIFNAN